MDRNELINSLQDFKDQCEKEGYGLGEIVREDAYPGALPTSFIVKVVAKDWIYQISVSEAIHQLLLILWKTTEPKIRENIFTLSIYRENERHLLEQSSLTQSV